MKQQAIITIDLDEGTIEVSDPSPMRQDISQIPFPISTNYAVLIAALSMERIKELMELPREMLHGVFLANLKMKVNRTNALKERGE